jgi:hypothetical protein
MDKLTSKIPCVFNQIVSNIVEEIIFSKNQNMRTWEATIGSLNCLIEHQPQKFTAHHSMGFTRL